VCRDCGEPTGRPKKALSCTPCAYKRRRATKARYQASPRGYAVRFKSWNRPAAKISRQAWVDAHPDQVRTYKRRYADKQPRLTGATKLCTVLGCKGHWTITRYNGARKFCASCKPLMYAYASTKAHNKYRAKAA
jgi:hypothetical protein